MTSEASSQLQIRADLPYYLPIPEDVTLGTARLGEQNYRISFRHFQPLRHPDDSQATRLDDRIGTFIRTRIFLEYDIQADDFELSTSATVEYERRALELINRLVDALRYCLNDFIYRPIRQFDNFEVIYYKTGEELIPGNVGQRFGPYGLRQLMTLRPDDVGFLAGLFNGIQPMNPAKLLLLDARYHSHFYDFNRAVLDIGIALDIHIEWLLEQFAWMDGDLRKLISNGNSIWCYYNEVLSTATGHSLIENPELYANFEYLRYLRNAVAHEWKPVFHIDKVIKSKFIDQHKQLDGTVIESVEQAEELITMANEILDFVERLFSRKYNG